VLGRRRMSRAGRVGLRVAGGELCAGVGGVIGGGGVPMGAIPRWCRMSWRSHPALFPPDWAMTALYSASERRVETTLARALPLTGRMAGERIRVYA
jgi:hypothetical protein